MVFPPSFVSCMDGGCAELRTVRLTALSDGRLFDVEALACRDSASFGMCAGYPC
jgi:hypothetical protein